VSPKLDPSHAVQTMREAGLEPLEPYSNALAKWKCLHLACGRIVFPKLNQIKNGQGGCLKCGQLRSANANRISENDAIAIMAKANLKPLVSFPGAKTPWHCLCMRCGKEVQPRYAAIRSGQGGCKYCAKRHLDQSDAVAIMVKSGFEPLGPFPGASKPWTSKCRNCGVISTPRFANVQRGSGCIICKNANKAIPRKIAASDAYQILFNAGMEPIEPYKNSKSPWKARCHICNKIGAPSLGNVIAGHKACAYCTKHKVDPIDAAKVMQKAGLRPLEPFVSVDKKWKCECKKCGEIVRPAYSWIRRGQGGCKRCGRLEGAKKQMLDSAEIYAFMIKNRLQPLEPYQGSGLPWKSQCLDCNNIVSPTYSNVSRGHNGCRFCSPAGFRMDKPSYIYLITHEELNTHKIGIGNVKKNNDRLTRFKKKGWKVHKVWSFQSGREALEHEKSVFRIIRKSLRIPIYLSYDEMKSTGGHAETMDAESITLIKLEKIVERVVSGSSLKPRNKALSQQ
jgi:hypothetical protein